MKAVVGVDWECHYRSALKLLNRLSFPQTETLMVHVLNGGSEILTRHAAKLVLEQFRDFDLLESSMSALPETKAASCIVLDGSPAKKLLEFADSSDADIICATATHSGAFNAFVLGSICRALSVGARQSVLIAKGEVAFRGPIKAVFATDHSPYAEACADKLLSLVPAGLSEVTVLSVVTPIVCDPVSGEVVQAIIEQEKKELAEIQSKTELLASKFQRFGAMSKALVQKGVATEQIAQAMKDTGADLLILGAQGHGFFDRLLIGSTSLHQVVSEHYSVFIVRA